MKRILVMLFVFCALVPFLAAEEEIVEETAWTGIVKFEPISLINGPYGAGLLSRYGTSSYYSTNNLIVPEVVITVVPLLSKVVGIPIVLDFAIYPKTIGLGIMSGIELSPMGKFAPGGLFFRLHAGAFWIPENNHVAVLGRANIGWQFLTRGGFVFTPGLGVKYNQDIGNSLDIMLDIGTAF